MAIMKCTEKKLRAAGYCRTSGEGQRDNTSIPRQREAIEFFCKTNGWTLVNIYVDESRSGSKIVGREDFQKMMRDAANGKFDIVVIYDISRFARDGADIIESSRTLKRDFGVHVVDTKGQYDTRSAKNTLVNFLHAGISQQERLTILERTITGRIARAKEGKPWSGDPPIGRAYDKENGHWIITDKGRAIAEVLRRYLNGEGSTELCRELLGVGPAKLSGWVHNGQLAGTYRARFRCPELDIDMEVPVPTVPEIVAVEVLEKVKARLTFNRTNNRRDVQKYYLTGFLRCAVCGRALTGRSPHKVRKTYYHGNHAPGCTLRTVSGDELEASVLDYLFNMFLDGPAFDEAVLRAMPSAKDRDGLKHEIAQTEKRLKTNGTEIEFLVAAIVKGVDASLLIDKQTALKAERDKLSQRLDELRNQAAKLPSVERTKQVATAIQIILYERIKGRDWRSLPFDDVRRFLLFLFGESTARSARGIFISKDESGRTVVKFKGCVDFRDWLVDGKPTDDAWEKRAAQYADDPWLAVQDLERNYTELQQGYEALTEGLKELGKPSMANLSAR